MTTGRALLAVLLTTSTVVGGVLVTSPASADTSETSSKADLDARLRSATVGDATTIRLGRDLTADDDAHDVLSTPDDSVVILDLHGQRLTLQQLTLGDGAALEITDSTGAGGATNGFLQVGSSDSSSSGTQTGIAIGAGAVVRVSAAHVAAYGSDVARSAGIGSPAGLTTDAGRLELTDGATVSGQGGKGGSGIGGAQAAAAIAVSVVDSTLVGRGGLGGAGIGSGRSGASFGGLTATSSVPATAGGDGAGGRSSSIDASGGRGAAGIGGGLHASGGAVRLEGVTDANASTDGAVTGSTGAPSAVGAGQAPAAASGTFGALHVGRRAWLWINDARDPLVVPADAQVVNDGSIRALGGVTGEGAIDNHGLISSASNYSPISPETDPGALIAVRVTGHAYEVVLHPNGGAEPSRSSIRVYCAYLDSGFLPSIAAPQQGWSLMGWNTKADGSGEDFSEQSLEELTGEESDGGSPVVLDLYARFGVTPHFTASSMPVAAVGRAYDATLPIAGEGITGYWISDQDEDGTKIPGLPAGLKYDASTGRVQGTPAEAGTYRLRAVTAGRNQLTGYVTLTVAGPPVILSGTLPAGQQGTVYSTPLAATGGGSLEWRVVEGSVPEGLSLSTSGVLSGTPTGSGRGSFTVQASNERGRTLATVDIDVEARSVASASSPTAPSPLPSTASMTPSPVQQQEGGQTAATAPAPVLVRPQRVIARFGRPLALSVSASSAAPVLYTLRGALPSGMTLDSRTGLVGGVPVESGTFRAVVMASNAGGSSSVAVTMVVAEPMELIGVERVGATWTGTRALPLAMTGLKKGERFRVMVDGRTVRRGTVRRSGLVRTSIHLGQVERDTVHRVNVSTDRRITDPGTTASTSFRITSLVGRKALKATRDGAGKGLRIVVRRLAAGESVVVRSNGAIVTRGRADTRGQYSFTPPKAGLGAHLLRVTGSTRTRSVTLMVRNAGR